MASIADEREVDSVLEGAGKSLLDIVEDRNRTLNKVGIGGVGYSVKFLLVSRCKCCKKSSNHDK